MNTIVTGCAGFIGSHLTEKLLKNGHSVVGIDNLSSGYESNIPDGCVFIEEDICNVPQEIFEGADVVFSQAASKKNICLKDPARDLQVNGGGILHLLECARKAGVKKFVHASTGSVYGEVPGRITEGTPTRPVSYYGVSKLAGESYVNLYNKLYDMDTTVLRYFHVYGDRQESHPDLGGVVSIFKKRILEGLDLPVHGDGDQQRVFTRVKDVVEANIQAWYNPASNGETYNCASSKRTTINELVMMLIKKYGRTGIVYTEGLKGDIYKFDVDSSHIGEIGVYFSDLNIENL